jgi:hypothetical protein
MQFEWLQRDKIERSGPARRARHAEYVSRVGDLGIAPKAAFACDIVEHVQHGVEHVANSSSIEVATYAGTSSTANKRTEQSRGLA